MASEDRQPTFEVYSPAVSGTTADPDPDGPMWEQPSPYSPAVPVVAPANRVPAPVEPLGTGRRTLITIGIGIAVGAVLLSAIVTQYPSQDEDAWVPDDVGSEDYQEIEVGGYLASVPQGWTLWMTSAAEALVTNGSNRLAAYAFNAAEGDRAGDLVKALTKGRLGAFSGKFSRVSDTSDVGVQRARITASGTLDGQDARLVGQLWIGPGARALLVVRVLTAPKGSMIDVEAMDMTAALSYEYGGAE